MDEKTSIKRYFKGKNVLVSGATGFLGKVLVEKLLRSCPDVNNIYLLIRPKRGKTVEERAKDITNTPLFDLIRKNNPTAVKKIIPIKGDTMQSGLGLSPEDRQVLIDNVSVVYHVAASVKFDDYLKYAVFANLRCTRDMALLALEMKNIEVFVHTSTTYCNIDNRKVVEEVLYPPQCDWKDTIKIAEDSDEQLLNTLTPKFIHPFPNTYTFTKQLGEHCINDLLVGKIPTVIYRPSVVISTISEPFQGWIDNFNGPVGLLIAGGSGLLRTVHGDETVHTDYVPVDNSAKGMIITCWHKAVTGNKDEILVINGSKYKEMPLPVGTLVDLGKRLYWDAPFDRKIWFPRNKMTNCAYEFYIKTMLFHMLPALFLDILLRVFGKKPILVKIQRKIYIANTAISYFMKNSWDFVNDNLQNLNRKLPEEEFDEFNCMVMPKNDQDVYEYYKTSCNFARYYLLKESKEIKPETFVKTKRMYYLDQFCRGLFYVFLFWFILFKINILAVLSKAICNYWESL